MPAPSMHRPVHTPTPDRHAMIASSVAQRVLPMPASPVSRQSRPLPARAAFSARTRRSMTSSRPRKGSPCATAGPATEAGRVTSATKRYPWPRTVSIGPGCDRPCPSALRAWLMLHGIAMGLELSPFQQASINSCLLTIRSRCSIRWRSVSKTRGCKRTGSPPRRSSPTAMSSTNSPNAKRMRAS